MEIDLVGTVVSAPALDAPLSGERVCAAVVEALKDRVVVGVSVLGDLLTLRTSEGDVQLVVRRATFAFATRFDDPRPLRDPVPAELVPLLRTGPDGLRERCVVPGDQFRIRARVTREAGFFVADDRVVIRLDEALSLTS